MQDLNHCQGSPSFHWSHHHWQPYVSHSEVGHLLDHCMFWAACSLGYFGFLWASKLTIPNLTNFSLMTHLGVQDITVDLKTDPFGKGCFIHIGIGPPLCTVHAVMTYFSIRGMHPVLCSCFKVVSLSCGLSFCGLDRSWPLLKCQETSPARASTLGKPLL